MNNNKHNAWGALFDLDGVLIDSENIYTIFWHNIDLKYPTGVNNFEYVIKGNTLGNILNTYFHEEEIQAEILKELKEHEASMEYQLFEGVEKFLRTLRQKGIVSAIVTSSNVKKMEHLFLKLPVLQELVDVIITENDVTRSKPDPQGYNIAAKRLGLLPNQCIVFEDSMAGVEAGRRAGGAVVGIATTNTKEHLMEFADVVFDSLAMIEISDLEKLILSYSQQM